MLTLYNGLTDQRKFFKFQFADDSIIDLDVSYPLDIMSKPNSVIVFSDGNMYSKKLADYERLLTESFYRIHHSIIVNLKWFSHKIPAEFWADLKYAELLREDAPVPAQ